LRITARAQRGAARQAVLDRRCHLDSLRFGGRRRTPLVRQAAVAARIYFIPACTAARRWSGERAGAAGPCCTPAQAS